MIDDITRLTLAFQGDVLKEVRAARQKWPGNADKLAALTEEVGELAQALLHHKHESGPATAIWKEAVQVAAMAIRVATEGSAEFPYDPMATRTRCAKPY